MVGDDLINDIQGAQNMGYTSFLVKTGKLRSSIYKTSSIRSDQLINSIAELPNYILSKNIASQAEIDQVKKIVNDEMASAVKFATESSEPDLNSLDKDVYL